MRSLALKLAVVGTGAAVMASASAASAASTGTLAGTTLTASGGGAFTLAKVAALSAALIGAAATGAVLVRHDATPVQPARTHMAPTVQAPVAPEPPVVAVTPTVERVAPVQPTREAAPTPTRETAVVATPEPSVTSTDESAPVSAGRERAATRSERKEARHQARVARQEAPRATASDVVTQESSRSHATRGASSGELELLHSARAALTMRPLTAFALTEQHRSTYPQGVFTQERDALAVEALLRAGDLDRARSLAKTFIERYPSSPHAHRFRETMNLQ